MEKKTLAFGLIRAFLALLAVPLPAHGERGAQRYGPFDLVRERWLNRCANGGTCRNAWEMDALFASQTYGGRRLADHRLLEGTTAPALLEAIREAFEDGKEEDLNIILLFRFWRIP